MRIKNYMLLLKCIGIYRIYENVQVEFLSVRVKSIRVAITISRPEPKNVEILTLEGKKSKAYNFNFLC